MTVFIVRQTDKISVAQCNTLGCQSTEFKLLFRLKRPVVECSKCGAKYILIDNNTRQSLSSQLDIHDSNKETNLYVECPYCDGSSWQSDAPHPCKDCLGSGKLDLSTEAKKIEKSKKHLNKETRLKER